MAATLSRIAVTLRTLNKSPLAVLMSARHSSMQSQQGSESESEAGGQLTGTWINELGSRMVLRHSLCGQIRGTYTTKVGEPGDQEDVHGFSNCKNNTFGISVSWNEGESLTSWTGQWFDGGNKLRAMWILTAENSPGEYWGSNLIGEDIFLKTADKENETN
ncbi:streptavidin-like [Glandiceps talaboti]